MAKLTSLEDLIKNHLDKIGTNGKPDSYDLYKHKNSLSGVKSYSDAVNSLYASSKKSMSSYGANKRYIHNKGLQNSGYASYIDDASQKTFETGLEKLKDAYAQKEGDNRASYASYLEKYSDKQMQIKNDVMSHLISNDIVDINTAIAYGMHAGLSREDAEAIGQSAYNITKQKVLNKILEQAVSLGLDKDGAKLLALKMGITESDADAIASEVGDLMNYYRDISDDYLDFLEQRANQ